MIALLVVAGAAVGAPARLWLDRFVQTRHDTALPGGTLLINVVGSLFLGFVAGAVQRGAVSSGVDAAVGAGFCGTFTTFSSFGYETVRLFEDRLRWTAAAYAIGSVCAGLAAATAGWGIAALVW